MTCKYAITSTQIRVYHANVLITTVKKFYRGALGSIL